MDISFCIQDPTHAETTYLYEAILKAALDAERWRGMYAFASRDGVDHLIEDPVTHEFMHKGGEIDLIVGIDAVTNRPTLERLRELEHRNRRFRPKVFWNESRGLFHPKISEFKYGDGRRTVVIGSGNLTPGGLVNNFECYTVISVNRGENFDVSALDDFLGRHAANIRSIDDGALERAARNLIRPIRGTRPTGGTTLRRRMPTPAETPYRESVAQFDRILIAQVPAAGGRWAQVHFNTYVVQKYFRITDQKTQRVYVSHIAADGSRSEVEVRPVIYSQTNKNHKIEIGAARGLEYTVGNPPILVFRERQLRTFDYMLLMPDEEGYAALIDLTRRLTSLGKGFPRVITDLSTLSKAWPNCPLLTMPDAEEQEI